MNGPEGVIALDREIFLYRIDDSGHAWVTQLGEGIEFMPDAALQAAIAADIEHQTNKKLGY